MSTDVRRVGSRSWRVLLRIILTVLMLCACAAGMALLWARERRDQRVAASIRELFKGIRDDPGEVVQDEDLDRLPEPVQLWLKTAGIVGKTPIRAYRMRQTGWFRTGSRQPWLPLQAEEYCIVEPASYLWSATLGLSGLGPLSAVDALRDGWAELHTEAFFRSEIGRDSGTDVDQAALVRWFGQMIWFPSFALSRRIRWERLSRHRVLATLIEHGVPLTLELVFDDVGLIDVRGQRYRALPDGPELTAWTTPLDAWDHRDGWFVPIQRRAVWHSEGEDVPYVDVHIEELEFDRPERLPRAPGILLFWPLLPIFVWNALWYASLPEGFGGNEGVPDWVLWGENATRVAVFAVPFFLRERGEDRLRPWVLWAGGTAVYFASWVPLILWPETQESTLLALGPAATPALFLAAIAWLARSWSYGFMAACFLALHIAHQLF